jgi:hypothetical protein
MKKLQEQKTILPQSCRMTKKQKIGDIRRDKKTGIAAGF